MGNNQVPYNELPSSDECPDSFAETHTKTAQRWKYIALGILSGVASAMLVIGLDTLRFARSGHHEAIVPSERHITVFFEAHPQYKSISHDSDSIWGQLMPTNKGFRFEEIDGVSVKVGIGMFHQIHCLQNIRSSLQMFVVDNMTVETSGWNGDNEHSSYVHILHCFDYLRQTILCHADEETEYPLRLQDGQGFSKIVNGSGLHKCRDPTRLYQLAEEAIGTTT